MKDGWTTEEVLLLLHSVEKHGEDAWSTVSDVMKAYIEKCNSLKKGDESELIRDPQIFTQSRCNRKYSEVISELKPSNGGKLESPSKGKKRAEDKYKTERMDELKKMIEEQELQIRKLRLEISEINSGRWDEKLGIVKEEHSGDDAPIHSRTRSLSNTKMSPVKDNGSLNRSRSSSMKRKTDEIPSVPSTPEIPTPGGGKRLLKKTPSKNTPTLSPDMTKKMEKIIQMLIEHKHGYVFRYPVTNEEAPDYDRIIKRRMDLSTIQANLAEGKIGSVVEFWRDLLLMYQNALKYNAKGSDIWIIANDMKKMTGKELDPLFGSEGLLRPKSLREMTKLRGQTTEVNTVAADREVAMLQRDNDQSVVEFEDEHSMDLEDEDDEPLILPSPKITKDPKKKSEGGKKKKSQSKRKREE
ncbi:bromodomain-containing protein [Planoprotostelium fungivorum]|uniref:Bromodomain-containing protein n=1 Tax=Planoprotostelium fungivorum TaxID=1890364 RepID=A0A2P6NBI4_9EUKA|nr:bromodomain-containing protein [Planoprotostelium fungivorum]